MGGREAVGASGGPVGAAAASTNADVTVVIANYNYGAFLPEAVASVLGQNGGAPRVVVVDDGSTDPSTLGALESLPTGVELVRQQNGGVSAARNTGYRLATTRYLMALDADDRLMPGALEDLRAALEADSSLGYAYGKTRFFGEWQGMLDLGPWDAWRLLYRPMIGPTCLTRREVFDACGGYDSEFRGFEDWEFWLNALGRGYRGLRIDAITLEYRRHGSTMLSGARSNYRHWYRRLRRKHRDVFRRRREFARTTDASVLDRVVYPTFWAWRPVPARVEQWLHSLYWKAGGAP